jgi:hypothetical protein
MQPNEKQIGRRIVRRLISDAIKAGYTINVYNGDDDDLELPAPSAKLGEIMGALFATFDEHIFLFRNGKRVGWIYLVHPNGADVITDYSRNLDPIVAGAIGLGNKWQEAAEK